ncbi:MAG: hypothetical protein HUJ91_07165 [Bacteroidales bacterium]|nr:hypothetical protein [Bacteroidales bacterium]
MKHLSKYIILAAATLFASACSEETLTPSGLDTDPSAKFNITNPIAKSLYDNTGVAVLSDYDIEKDVLYLGADYGKDKTTTISLLDNQDDIDFAIDWLNKKLFPVFSTEMLKTKFPRRVYLAKELTSVMGYATTLGNWLMLLRWTNNYWGINGIQHALPFPQGLVVNVNPVYLRAEDSSTYDMQFSEDILSIAIIYILMEYDLIDPCLNNSKIMIDEMTAKMYGGIYPLNTYRDQTLPGSSHSYKAMTAMGMGEIFDGYSASDTKYGDSEVCNCLDTTKIHLKYYFRYGFVDEPDRNGIYTSHFYFPKEDGSLYTWSSTKYPGYTSAKGAITCQTDCYTTSLGTCRTPTDIHEDVWNMVQALVHLNEIRWDTYGERIQQRLTGLHEYLRSLGIDIGKYNPYVDRLVPKE